MDDHMITKRTLFILGAGASMPYKLPSGAELRNTLCQAHTHPIQHTLHGKFEIPANDVRAFAEAFLKSRQPSIDTFLAKRQDLAELGKLCIAIHLCQTERSELLFAPDIEDDWYLALWNALQDEVHSAASITSNPVRFVTFNYDRSLECFLHEATKNSFGISDEDAGNICKRLNIQHVYGHLGAYKWDQKSQGRAYAYNDTAIDFTKAAEGIRVIPETREGDATFQAVRASVEWAEQICILGFGFDPLNMQRLGLNIVFDWLADRGKTLPIVYASTYGMTPAEVTRIQRAYFPQVVLNTFPHKNLMTLRESGVLT